MNETPQPGHAFTLIELVGVLAVIAILAGVLAPALIRQMDKIAGDQESASLKSFGDALQQSILRNRFIPATNNLAATIAAELGVDLANVITNPRRNNRGFLVDPAWQIGTNTAGQAYQQTNTGSAITSGGVVIPPVATRLLILSSIGGTLPAALTNGVVPSAANFTNLWNAADGTVPAAAPAFSGWAGSGDDLKIQRVNLSPVFVRLVLTWYNSSGTPRYSVDSTNSDPSIAFTNATPVPNNSAIDAYFIQNSVLTLYRHKTNSAFAGTIDSQRLLIQDNSFVYNQNAWQSSILGGSLVGGLDLATVADQFLKAPHNPRAQYTTNQQVLVVSNMNAFFTAYSAWADATPTPFPSGALKTAAGNAQSAMKTAVQGLYSANSFNPTNVPCPP